MAPVKADNPTADWKELISIAYFSRIGLSATGYYRTPGLGYDIKTGKGTPFNYFCYGAACTTVEVDVLTGDQ